VITIFPERVKRKGGGSPTSPAKCALYRMSQALSKEAKKKNTSEIGKGGTHDTDRQTL